MAGGIDWNEISANAMGGTEYMARELEKRLDPSLLEQFQIIPSRVMNPLQADKLRVLWLHDLPGDPSADHLANGGWSRFHALVFVSNWQAQKFIDHYDIPYSKCVVLLNAISEMATWLPGADGKRRADDPVRLAYTTTPHRGLEILFPAFVELARKDPDITLDIFSSFSMYGEAWRQRDEQYEGLFKALSEHPQITYHGAKPRDEMLKTLTNCDVFAYPSMWQETSCLCLIEAMAAGLDCVHSNYGALFETGAGLTSMYHYDEDKSRHAGRLMLMLETSIRMVRARPESWVHRLRWQQKYAEAFYSWDSRVRQWDAFLRSMLDLPREIKEPEQTFIYRA